MCDYDYNLFQLVLKYKKMQVPIKKSRKTEYATTISNKIIHMSAFARSVRHTSSIIHHDMRNYIRIISSFLVLNSATKHCH